jgi:hypothetical protein
LITHRNPRRRRAPLAGLLVIAGVSLAATTVTPAPGVTYRMRSELVPPDMPGMASQGPAILIGHGSALKGLNRFEFDTVSGALQQVFSAGDYMLVLDSGKMLSVSPSSKSYTEGNPAMNAIPAGLLQQATISGVAVNVEKLGPADTIQGYPTQKYRITTQYTMGIMGQSLSANGTQEIWMAQLPSNITTPFSGGMPKEMMTGAMQEIGTQTAAAWKTIGDGTMLKMVSNQAMNAGGMALNTTQTIELSDIKVGEVDPVVFKIPDGYTKRP